MCHFNELRDYSVFRFVKQPGPGGGMRRVGREAGYWVYPSFCCSVLVLINIGGNHLWAKFVYWGAISAICLEGAFS